ncbi:MAG: EAL domain-containing response regulator [Pseudomonadota bacterium]|nr:EAL domain-containing response regulator [Pseudomonadota bacterium]
MLAREGFLFERIQVSLRIKLIFHPLRLKRTCSPPIFCIFLRNPEPTLKNRAALILDDDPVFSALLTELLSASGISKIDYCEDGRALLQKQSELDAANLLFCDLSMPGMDGVEFLDRLAKKSWPGEVIIVSGEPESVISAASQFARLSGVALRDSIRKPVSMERLTTALGAFAEPQIHRPKPRVTEDAPTRLRSILSADGVRAAYQPQFNVRTGRIDGFEALMRLNGPEGQLLSPGEFWAGMQTLDLEQEFTFQFLNTVFEEISGWKSWNASTRCSVNLSPSMLKLIQIPDILNGLCNKYDIAPGSIVIEVTEAETLEPDAALMKAMSRLRIAGFGLALDDFGSGYANIQELGWLPFSEIKTDLAFGQKIETDRFSRAVIEFAARSATQLGLMLTVEGTETDNAIIAAKASGATRVQGYAIAKPLTGSIAEKLINGV